MSKAADLQAAADELPWFHSIDLGGGVTTRGMSDSGATLREDQLPSVTGKSVLDIGAWDGYYSFLSERLGASRVVALDHYVWGVDMVARNKYWTECFDSGTLADHSRDTTDFWRSDLPGRRSFDFAAKALNSNVEPLMADFATADLTDLDVFDVVFYLGVLYHMKEPLTCLERLRSVTREVAVVETQAVHYQGLEDHQLMLFYAGGEINVDFGNWYVPTMSGLKAMLLAAGFSSVEIIQGPPPGPVVPDPVPPTPRGRLRGRRTEVTELPPAIESPPTGFYRSVVHAYV